MKRIPILVALALSGLSFAQTRVWDNVREKATNSYGPAGPTAGGALGGQAGASLWTRWPERGPGIDFGAPQVLTEMTIYYLDNNGGSALTGNENVTVQIYANDGAPLTGDAGFVFNAPNTLLFTSPPIKVYPGDQCARISIPSVSVPAKITWTLKFQGGLFDTGPYDPALATNIPGGRFWGSIPFLNVQGPTGVMMRRVFTTAGVSAWGAQERPATYPTTIPFVLGADFMSGNTALITTPYDNGTTILGQGGFLALGDPAGLLQPFAAAGNLVTFEGPNKKVTQIDFGYYADTTSSLGSPTFNIKFLKQNQTGIWTGPNGGGTPDDAQVLWDSGPQPIPLGQGGGGQGALQNVTLPVPNIVVPESFFWVMTVSGLSGSDDDIVGPGIMWGPIPGHAPNAVAGKDATLTWQNYVFPPSNPPPTFVYDTIADLGPMKFTASAASGTETLAPISELINLGTTGSGGNLASWAADDNNARRVCKFFVPNTTSPYARITLGFTTTKPAPTAVTFEVKAKTETAGAFAIRLFIQNKVSTLFDLVLNNTALTLSYVVYDGNATGTLTNYVGGGGAMSGMIEVQQTGPSAQVLPCSLFEYGNMKVTG